MIAYFWQGGIQYTDASLRYGLYRRWQNGSQAKK